MKDKIHIRNIGDVFPVNDDFSIIRTKINSTVLGSNGVSNKLSHPTYLNAFIAILVLSGNCSISINYKTYNIETDTIVVLTASHLFYLKRCSNDFMCRCLFVSKEFTDEMDATDMIYKRIKYGARLYNHPIIALCKTDALLLEERLSAVERAIDNNSHSFHKEVILNSLFAYYLDLSDMIERKFDTEYGNDNLSRYENIIKSFIELLVVNYRKEHKVQFYASQLNITAHYLTLIVKRITGQTVNDLIFEMLFSEARNLLVHSRMSIQEIAALLNFADQSSFAKFFKRRAGVSPIDFRRI